jgi:hypothetical protein
MAISLRRRLTAFALSLVATGALVACGSVTEGNGNSPQVETSSTTVDPKPGEHQALAPASNGTRAAAAVCTLIDCRSGPR